ncbi:hypothetical protein CALVIDRAFT_538520 [Calocera viscosa TUFC12733]|uniref:NADH dehydrogenase [ubiquinone] 1 beta subcomplex subunit 11, mitochondrial n=1 Tax=Calocera viscosa (strain TUFC12733) TaxID=1330018 RepID=A0A167KVI2_CALVF|nr:hypothetical protein CALVIDRAFT_538520 [Calocera viscosa TUFC12733]
MPLPTPSHALRLHLRSISHSRRALSTSAVRRSAHGGPHYNEPSGWLFGEKPPPPGQKRKLEDWELPWYIGMYGGLLVCGIALAFKPDTSIQTWAMKEARERMDARGEVYKYVPSKYVRGYEEPAVDPEEVPAPTGTSTRLV